MARGAARRHGGVLSPLQEQVGRIVTSLPEAAGFALAGGATLVSTRVVDALGGRGPCRGRVVAPGSRDRPGDARYGPTAPAAHRHRRGHPEVLLPSGPAAGSNPKPSTAAAHQRHPLERVEEVMRTRPRRGYAAMLPDRRPHHRRSRSAQPCRRSRTRHRLRCTGADIGTELIDPSVSSAASSTWATSAAPKPQPTAGGRGLRMRRWRWPPRRAASAQRRVRGRERDAVADGHPRRHRQHGGDLAAQQRPEARAGDAQRCAGQQRAERYGQPRRSPGGRLRPRPTRREMRRGVRSSSWRLP